MNAAFPHLHVRRLLLAVFVVRLAGSLAAQEPPPVAAKSSDYLVQNWQTDDGLPRNTITALAQDQQGYLWLGTPHGLIRFDGVRFVAFEGPASPALAQGYVQRIFCDEAGVLWIATRRSGLLRYQGGVVSREPRVESAAIDSLTQDGPGNLWLTDGSGRLGRLTTDAFTPTARLGEIASGPMLFKLTADAAGGLWFFKQSTYGQLIGGQPANVTTYPGSVLTLAPSHAGGLWVSTGNNLRRVPAGQTAVPEILLALPFGDYGVSALYEDRSGTLWVGTAGDGLFRLRDGRLEPVGKIDHKIWDILQDAEGNVWVGTDGAGLFKLRPRVFSTIGKNEGLPGDSVLSVCGDWVAPGGPGLGKLVASVGVEMLAGFQRRSIAAVLEDGGGGLWLGTSAGQLLQRNGAGKLSPGMLMESAALQLRVLHRDQTGNVWVGAYPHGLFRVPAGDSNHWENLSKLGFTNVSVTAMAEETNGVIWIGTSDGELHRFQAGRFRTYGLADGLPRFPIGVLLPAPSGGLWVGTLGGGLGRFQDGRARFLGVAAGLVDNVISQLIEDGRGWLWIGSSRGLARTPAAELVAVLDGRKAEAAMIRYGRADGLANIQCTAEHQPSAWLTRAGQLRFATSKGVVMVDPAAIPLNRRPPPLTLEAVLVDGVAITNPIALKLAHDYKKIEFRYAALSLVAPENVLFKRRLVGFDDDWVEAGTQRSATYPRLPPGRYRFQFTACNNDGIWNETPLPLAFAVTPAFWQTLWFRAAAGVLGVMLISGVARFAAAVKLRRKILRLEQAQLVERERLRIARDLHDDLGARLTQMAFLTDLAADEAGAPPALRMQLRTISRQARSTVQSLDETVWLVNPRKDTLPHLIGYLATYAEQFFEPTEIRCRLEICRQPPERALPGTLRRDLFLLVKEALNNVLKHSGAVEVWLRITVRGPVLRIVIADNGRGFLVSPAASQRNGLENMRRRAQAAGIRFRLHSAPGRGTRVVFRVGLPLLPKSIRAGFERELGR